ncbi:MAG: DNA polymerase III subunit delta' [Deltaproteobacteria bacterium]|nr:DNA polymerase III subunit delta' [Deltaproteobacteria bacterium]
MAEPTPKPPVVIRRFAEIVGHAPQKALLAQAEARERAHHAYLFTGADGIGKRRVAYAFIARLLCKQPIALSPGADPSLGFEACGACRNCIRVFETPTWYDDRAPFPAKEDAPELAPRHPDVMTLLPHGQYIKISQVREVLRIVPFQPVEAPVRVVVIDDAHLMNDEAANALLKTLEEPPARTRFILLTSLPSSLLVTIRSRCQKVAFARLSDAELMTMLTQLNADPAAIARAIPLAQGSARAAIELLDDPLGAIWEPLARELLTVRDQPSVHALAASLAEIPQLDAVFDRVARLLRDALLIRTGASAAAHGLFHRSLVDALTTWAQSQSSESILHRLELVEDTRQLTRTFNMQARLAFERLLLEISAPVGAEGARPMLARRDIL